MFTMYVEVSSLKPSQYTGISNVLANFIECVLNDEDVEPRFFAGCHEIPRHVVETQIQIKNGLLFSELWLRNYYDAKIITPGQFDGQRVVGFFPNIKPVRGVFPVEAPLKTSFPY